MGKTIMSEFLDRKHQYDAETELMQELEKKPMTEGQVKDLLSRGLNDYEQAKAYKRFEGLITDFRAKGLIIEDSPVTFTQFKKDNPGVIIFRQSTFYQMELGEYEAFKRALEPTNRSMLTQPVHPKQWKLYEDMPVQVSGQHSNREIYHYRYNSNGMKQTGYGFRITVHLLPSPVSREDEQKINAAKRLYAQARNEIAEVFNKLEIPITPEAERQP